VPGGQITIRLATPSSWISANAAVNWSFVVSRIDRPDNSLGWWQLRLKPFSRFSIATLEVAPQRTRQRKQPVLISASLIDATGLASAFVHLDEFPEGNGWDGDI
jgi:hypothetical protein